MAKKKDKSEEMTFAVGVDLSDNRRFEAGDKVPADISKEDLDALKEMNAIGESE